MKTLNGVDVTDLPNGATWTKSDDFWIFSWIPEESDVNKTYNVTFRVTKSIAGGTERQSQTITFKVIQGSVTDVDGNVYNTVIIGTQVWMKENLKTSKYRNRDVIPTGLNNTEWSSTTSGAYAIYNNDNRNNDTYGKLYNWYTVVDSRNLCPSGWHVPTDNEWHNLALTLYANSTLQIGTGIESNIAGGKLKETGTTHWSSPNIGAINEYGFTALPGGNRDTGGTFIGVGTYRVVVGFD